MRKVLVISSAIFTVLGVVLAVFPLGTIPLLPVGLALILAILAFIKSNNSQKKFPRVLLLISAITLLVVIGKEVFIKNEVVIDQQFEKTKIESNKDDIKELEGLK